MLKKFDVLSMIILSNSIFKKSDSALLHQINLMSFNNHSLIAIVFLNAQYDNTKKYKMKVYLFVSKNKMPSTKSNKIEQMEAFVCEFVSFFIIYSSTRFKIASKSVGLHSEKTSIISLLCQS